MSLKRQRKNETSSEHESTFCSCKSEADDSDPNILVSFLAPAVTVGETEGAMDSPSVFFFILLLPITL